MDDTSANGPEIAVSQEASCPDHSWADAAIYTIGHSTRPLEELIGLLHRYGVATLADVRAMPRSRRNPQFNIEELTIAVPPTGIAYAHLPRLGGLRRGLGAGSPNTGWRNASFRAYADYMQTADFARGLDELHALAATGTVALMCAEAVPWRCHRSLIADALLVRGVASHDIQSRTRALPHKLTPFARVDGERITYPEDP
ncbi:MAG TPA: DUF488 domain-containing protein [Thermomicrobiales bacterium]|nr:DUF488 domain-containing protein [Thermomicrobiales bacterium]